MFEHHFWLAQGASCRSFNSQMTCAFTGTPLLFRCQLAMKSINNGVPCTERLHLYIDTPRWFFRTTTMDCSILRGNLWWFTSGFRGHPTNKARFAYANFPSDLNGSMPWQHENQWLLEGLLNPNNSGCFESLWINQIPGNMHRTCCLQPEHVLASWPNAELVPKPKFPDNLTLVGGWAYPFWKIMSSSIGMILIPNWMDK